MKSLINDFKIRNGLPEDAKEIAKINVLASKEVYKDILPANFLSELLPEKREPIYLKRLTTPEVRTFVSVIEKKGEIVAFSDIGPSRVQGRKNDCELYSIYCLPAYQRIGLGTDLFKASLNEAKRNARYQNLILSVFSANEKAIRFYDHLDGQRDGDDYISVHGTSFPITSFKWKLR